MKWKIVVCLLAVFSIAAIASAQDVPKLDVFVGYSYFRENPSTSGVSSFNLHGGSASVAYNAKNWLSRVADFGRYHADPKSTRLNSSHSQISYSVFCF